MAEETKVEQAVADTTQEVAVVQNAEPEQKPEGAEIDDLREAMKKSDWVARLVGGGEKKEAVEAKADDGKAKEAAATEEAKTDEKVAEKTAGAVVEEKPKKRQPKRAEEQPRQDIDVGAVAEAAAESAARTVAKMQAGKDDDSIPEHIKKDEHVYAELEKLDPKKYSGIMRRRAEFARKEEERAAEWARAHQGEAYDPDAEDHKGWYESNEPDIDPDDYDEAKFQARLNKAIAEKLKPEIDKTRAEVEKSRVEPLAVASAANVTEKVLGAFVDGAQLTRETVKKLIEDDPDAYEIAVQVDNAFRPVAAAVPKLYRGVEQFDEKNQAHVAARGMLSKMESELAASDHDQLVRGGKKWVPLSQYYNTPSEKRGSLWCLSENDIANYVALTAQQEAKKAYDSHQKRMDDYAKRHGWAKQDATKAKQTEVAEGKPAQQHKAQQTAQTKSPSVGSAPAVGSQTTKVDSVSNDLLSPLWTRMGLPA